MNELKQQVIKQLNYMIELGKKLQNMTNEEYDEYLDNRIQAKVTLGTPEKQAIKGQTWYLEESIRLLDREYFKEALNTGIKKLEIEMLDDDMSDDDIFDLLMS